MKVNFFLKRHVNVNLNEKLEFMAYKIFSRNICLFRINIISSEYLSPSFIPPNRCYSMQFDQLLPELDPMVKIFMPKCRWYMAQHCQKYRSKCWTWFLFEDIFFLWVIQKSDDQWSFSNLDTLSGNLWVICYPVHRRFENRDQSDLDLVIYQQFQLFCPPCFCGYFSVVMSHIHSAINRGCNVHSVLSFPLIMPLIF